MGWLKGRSGGGGLLVLKGCRIGVCVRECWISGGFSRRRRNGPNDAVWMIGHDACSGVNRSNCEPKT